jgi:hypothetical protein
VQLLPPQAGKLRQVAEAFDQDFECSLVGFPGADPNTPSSAAPFKLPTAINPAALAAGSKALLVSWTQPTTTGSLMGKFTARFAIVPASWDDFSQLVNFSFPGWLGALGTSTIRQSKPAEVIARLHRDYFVVDPDGLAAGIKDSNGAVITSVTSMGLIPRNGRQFFWNTLPGGTSLQPEGVWAPSLVLAAGYLGYLPTIPTTECYQSWITNAAPYLGPTPSNTWSEINPKKWDGATNDTTAGQFIYKDSWLEIYAGNIMARVTGWLLPI